VDPSFVVASILGLLKIAIYDMLISIYPDFYIHCIKCIAATYGLGKRMDNTTSI